jgi:hypothetical protein
MVSAAKDKNGLIYINLASTSINFFFRFHINELMVEDSFTTKPTIADGFPAYPAETGSAINSGNRPPTID